MVDQAIFNIFNTPFNDIISFSFENEQKLNEAIQSVLSESNMINSDQLVLKLKQLLQIFGSTITYKEIRRVQSNNSVIVVGRPLSGKSEMIKLAAKAY